MAEAVLVAACRTPIGKFQGKLAPYKAPQLGAMAIAEAVKRAGIAPADVQEVIFGTVLQAGLGQNPARQAALGAGLPVTVGAMTINKVCGSGLKSVALAAQAIRAGDADVVVAGGQESMTNAPYLMPGARDGMRLGHGKLLDAMVHDGLWDAYNDFHMGVTGDLVAQKCGVTREDQDRFAAESHRRAAAAQASGAFGKEIFAIEQKDKKGNVTRIDVDEGVRGDTTAEGLGKMRAAFAADGTVTAGNASQISDGAAAVVVMSDVEAKRRGLRPLARVTGYATGGTEPKWVMLAPIYAVQNLEKRNGIPVAAYDLVEVNEAFSSAACAVTKELKLDPSRTNVNGGAVALGHPIGASGCRILVTLLHALEARGGKKGLAALCLGGGNAVALSVERV
ncbi:MAG: acetyl-CoA C-acetyltransferase [Planctomycetes bacterium]|nr:acetyl-CoA C-acetyltransferase [Planctomycetota bacterium]